jgi:hypothetical protein
MMDAHRDADMTHTYGTLAPETTQIEAEPRSIQSIERSRAATRWLALSKLWLVKRPASASHKATRKAWSRRIKQLDYALCCLP